MQRNKLPRFRNKGQGDHTTSDGRIVSPGETFRDDPRNIPTVFRDKIELLDNLEPEPEPEPANLLVKRHKGGGKFNIENYNTGKVLNTRYLTKSEAEQIIQDQDFQSFTDEYERGPHDEELNEQAEPQEEDEAEEGLEDEE